MPLNMFRASSCPSSEAYQQQQQPLVYGRNVVVALLWCVVGGRCQAQCVPDNVHQLHVQTTFHIWKPRGCQCSFRLLMMGGVSPETCWVTYKYGIITFWYIRILLDISLWISLRNLLLWTTETPGCFRTTYWEGFTGPVTAFISNRISF
jgi:hypothetical protein